MRRFFCLTLCILLGSTPLRAQSPEGSCRQLSGRLEQVLGQRQIVVSSAPWVWKELSDFHSFLLEAMALDPAHVPPDETPDSLLPENLNVQLKSKLDHLIQARSVASRLGLEAELDHYLTLVQDLLDQREQGFYTRARRMVKRGPLHQAHSRLHLRLQERGPHHMEVKVAWAEDQTGQELAQEMAALSLHLQGAGNRSPASWTQPYIWVRSLFWILVPLLLLTGWVAGLLWQRRQGGEWSQEPFEPKP